MASCSSEPVGTEFATWLKGELASRFKVPVKYVIYSHHHWDHGSGASVYADTARIVGHEAMMARLAMPPADTPLPQNARAQDADGNGRIEQKEAQGNLQTQFALYDAESQRRAERRRSDTRAAGLRASSRSHLSRSDHDHTRRQAGGGSPEADGARRRQHHRPFRGRHRRVVRLGLDHGEARAFRRRRGDQARTGPGQRRSKHSSSITLSAVTACWARRRTCIANIRYREELREAVAKAIAAGQTLEQAQASVTMDAYKDWEFYAQQRPANVAGTYRALTSGR